MPVVSCRFIKDAKMPKAEKGTPKWLANKMKSKGLQKLRWYCQMCQKQCRDQNGFKCHIESESHQRQLLLFADNPNKFVGEYSAEFERDFLSLLSRTKGSKRVKANKVYQEYIANKEHVHMNSTKWVTLTGFVQYLGRTGKCKVDQTEEGWFISFIDRDPETIARQEALAKKQKLEKDDSERMADFIQQQVLKAKNDEEENENEQRHELIRESDDKVQLELNMVDVKKPVKLSLPSTNSVFSSRDSKKEAFKEKRSSKKKSALESIMEEEQERKRRLNQRSEHERESKSSREGVKDYWLKKNIVVKIVAKELGQDYYKKKAYVSEVVNKYGAIVVLLGDNKTKIKVDQTHLETVVPSEGRMVLVLQGRYRGERAVLKSIDIDNFCAELELEHDRKCITLPYEHFSKVHKEESH